MQSDYVHRWAVNASVFQDDYCEHTLAHTLTGAELLLAVKFNMNHRRSDSLHHVSDEVVFVSWAVGVVLGWGTQTNTYI